MYVEEKNRSWCTSSSANDHRAITIEVASDTTHPYAVNDKAFAALLDLVTDICMRNGIKQLVWSTDKTQRVNHLNGCNMTVHRDYANKSCPGQYLYDRHGEIAEKVNERLNAANSSVPEDKPVAPAPAKISEGDIVEIADNAVYYNGKTVPAWVKAKDWYVDDVDGDRAVIDRSVDGKNAICSPINTKYLTVVKPAQNGSQGAEKVKLEKGVVVTFTGKKHYSSANSKTTVPCKPGKATITLDPYLKGKHPYHLVAVKGGTSNVYGWVDAEDIYEAQEHHTEEFTPYERKLGYTDASYTAAVDSGTYTNFVKDSAGYGLAQWTYWSRKQALLDFAKARKASIGDLEMQLEFLVKELNNYGAVLRVLKNAKSIREASDIVLTQYERPANQGESVKKQRAAYGQTYYDKFVTKKEATTMSTKITTAAQLAKKAIDVAKNYKTLYVMGCFGAPMNASNKERYCSNHKYNTDPTRTAMIRAASADTFGFDCVCFIKGLLWGWCGDKSKVYGGAGYAINGVPDIGADTMITKCSGISTDFSKIEAGEAVWMEGHIGIYVGNGLAVECTPKWKNCVQLTACNCSKSGYNRRNWTKHGKLPYVTYTGKTENVNSSASTEESAGSSVNTSGKLKIGDIVNFKGSKHYASANATSGPGCKPGKAKVTALYPSGKHPVHLVAVSGSGSTVYGWVNTSDIEGAAQAENWTPKVGDIVKYNGSTHYTSANSTSAKSCKGGQAKITQIYQLGKSKHPYHLVRVAGKGATVYGWVDAGSFVKV